MLRILLGALIGAAATASYLQRQGSTGSQGRPAGRVDELSSADDNVIADPSVNAGDSTGQAAYPTRSPAVTP